jgi:hypothetical protein
MKESQIFVCIFVHICVQNTTCGKNEKKKEKNPAQIRTNVRGRGFNAGLLAKSKFPSLGPATDQLDQGFPWFSLVPEKMLSWYLNSMLHRMLPMKPSQW